MNKQEFLEYASALWTVHHAAADVASVQLIDQLKNTHGAPAPAHPCVSPEGWGADAAQAIEKARGKDEQFSLDRKLHLIAEYYQSAPLLKLTPPPYALPNDPADDDQFEKTRRAFIDTINLAHTCLVPLCETLEIACDGVPSSVDALCGKELRRMRDRAVDNKRALVDLAYAVGHLSPDMEKQMEPSWFDCLAHASRTERDLFYAFCVRWCASVQITPALDDMGYMVTFDVWLSEQLYISVAFATFSELVTVKINMR